MTKCKKCEKTTVNPPKYRISRNAWGAIEVDAPTLKDSLALFWEVDRPTRLKIEEAIR